MGKQLLHSFQNAWQEKISKSVLTAGLRLRNQKKLLQLNSDIYDTYIAILKQVVGGGGSGSRSYNVCS
jgi:hypothetical protein